MTVMNDPLSDAELAEIHERLSSALKIAPPPWTAWLETRAATGGESFVQFDGDPDVDNEMYLRIHLGRERLVSPDPRLDAIIDFVGHAAHDVEQLVREIRRLRGLSSADSA